MTFGDIRQGSAPNFCPPIKEGEVLEFIDENSDKLQLEFLGIILKGDRQYAFFFPIDDDNPALSSGEVVILEVVSTDEDGSAQDFELVDDQAIAGELYEDFKEATKDIYRFE